MLTSWELWTCAHKVFEQHGEEAPHFVAERIGCLVTARDLDGVAMWKAIAVRVDQLTRRPLGEHDGGSVHVLGS